MQPARINRQKLGAFALLIVVALLALVTLLKSPRQDQGPADDAAADGSFQDPSVTGAFTQPNAGVSPDGRPLNAAGLPIGPPLPPPKPVPIKAAPGQVIGYATDSKGNATPIRAGNVKAIPNSEGTYVAVDMWADGGSVAVAPQRTGPSLTEADIKRLMAEEAAQDQRRARVPRVEPKGNPDL